MVQQPPDAAEVVPRLTSVSKQKVQFVTHRNLRHHRSVRYSHNAQGPARDATRFEIGHGLIFIALLVLMGITLHSGIPNPQACAAQVGTEPEVRIYYTDSAPITAAQRWLAALAPLQLTDLRIAKAPSATRPNVTRSSGRLRVVAVIDRAGVLHVPGRQFNDRQAAQFGTWLQNQDRPGATAGDQVDRQATRLGDQWQRRLAGSITASTRDQLRSTVMASLQQTHQIQLQPLHPADRLSPATDYRLTSELRGLSVGTVLAIVLRNERRVLLVPTQQPPPAAGSTVQLQYSLDAGDRQAWPAGRAPTRPSRDLAPKLLEFAPIAIRQTSVTRVLDALEPRIGIPIVVDQIACQRRRIDLDKQLVDHPSRRTFYRKAIDTCLSQARLKSELLVDDNGQPLLWVTPQLSR